MLKSEADRLRRVVVCTPTEEYYRAENLKAHNILEPADRDRALGQHRRLKDLLTRAGAEVIDLSELPGHPNSVFTRDAALVTPEGYIHLQPGIDTRRAEGDWMADRLDRLGEPCFGRIEPPGTVDGGDVVLLDGVAFIGLSGRTNRAGCLQLTGYLEKMGYQVRPVKLPQTILHLDKVVMPVDGDRLLACPDIVPRDLLAGFEVIAIDFSETSGANIICLGGGRLIVARANQGALEALDGRGLSVEAVEVSEFAKGAGGPNCLIMPLDRRF